MSNFLANSERFIKRNASNKDFMQNMVNVYKRSLTWYLSMNDLGLHIIGARMALYNFHKYPAHRLAFWKLYLQHKNEFFKPYINAQYRFYTDSAHQIWWEEMSVKTH